MQNRVTFLHSILKCHGTGNLEGHFGRVDFMVGTIVYICMYANYRITAKDTSLHSLFDTRAKVATYYFHAQFDTVFPIVL